MSFVIAKPHPRLRPRCCSLRRIFGFGAPAGGLAGGHWPAASSTSLPSLRFAAANRFLRQFRRVALVRNRRFRKRDGAPAAGPEGKIPRRTSSEAAAPHGAAQHKNARMRLRKPTKLRLHRSRTTTCVPDCRNCALRGGTGGPPHRPHQSAPSPPLADLRSARGHGRSA